MADLPVVNPVALDTGINVTATTPAADTNSPFATTNNTVIQNLLNPQNQTFGLGLTSFQNTITTYAAPNLQSNTINPDSLAGLDNVLDSYANYTYHIRFSIGESSAARTTTMTNVDNMKKAVIAESGTIAETTNAQYTITKFNFTNTVAPGFKHQNMNAMTFSMTITEPFGLTLPDYIQLKAKDLGIENEKRFYYFIELWFNGYDENGNIVKRIGDVYKAWRIMMTDMSFQTTHIGTTYEITGLADNDLINVNQIAMSQSTIEIKDVKTMKDVVTRLTEELNKDAESAEGKKPNPTKYEIVLPKEVEKWSLVAPDSVKQNNKEYSKEGVILKFNRGNDLGNFILQAMSKCGDNMEKFLLGTQTENGIGQFPLLVPTMKLGPYDQYFNDYQRTVVFRIVPYYTPRSAVRDPKTAAIQNRLSVQQGKFNFLKQENLIAKRYDYIYTGKNTQIIKFDINVKHFWQILIPGYLGGRTYGQSTVGPLADERNQNFNENKSYAPIYKLPSIVAAAQALDSVSQSFQNINGSALTNLTSATTGLITTSPSLLTDFASNILNQTPASTTQSTLPMLAQEGVANKIAQYQDFANLPEDLGKSGPWPVSFFVDNTPTAQNAVVGGLERKNAPNPSNQKAGGLPDSQGIIGSTIFNMFDKSQFVKITLEIRGDPYWIGQTNMEITEFVSGKQGPPGSSSQQYADFIKGENMFLLHFKTGTNYSEQTGLMELDEGSHSFNGIYSVLTVENNFENGSFTQVLLAYKDMFSQKVSEKLIPVATNSNVTN